MRISTMAIMALALAVPVIGIQMSGATLPGISLVDSADAQDAHAVPALRLAPNGLALQDMESQATDLIGFGTSQDDTVRFVGTALGEPTASGLNEECPGGAMAWVKFQGGLQLNFRAGEFAGWMVEEESGYSGLNGIRIGMTFGELTRLGREVVGEDSSLGHEFTADGYAGFLSGSANDAQITSIHAGQNCFAR